MTNKDLPASETNAQKFDNPMNEDNIFEVEGRNARGQPTLEEFCAVCELSKLWDAAAAGPRQNRRDTTCTLNKVGVQALLGTIRAILWKETEEGYEKKDTHAAALTDKGLVRMSSHGARSTTRSPDGRQPQEPQDEEAKVADAVIRYVKSQRERQADWACCGLRRFEHEVDQETGDRKLEHDVEQHGVYFEEFIHWWRAQLPTELPFDVAQVQGDPSSKPKLFKVVDETSLIKESTARPPDGRQPQEADKNLYKVDRIVEVDGSDSDNTPGGVKLRVKTPPTTCLEDSNGKPKEKAKAKPWQNVCFESVFEMVEDVSQDSVAPQATPGGPDQNSWLYARLCTLDSGMVFVLLWGATLAVLRLWIAELDVIAYGPCGEIDASFKETQEYETLFYWCIAPILWYAWYEVYFISQLRRVVNGPNGIRIPSLTSNPKVSFHDFSQPQTFAYLREHRCFAHVYSIFSGGSVAQDIPDWWATEVRSVWYPCPAEQLISIVNYGAYGVHQGKFGSGLWFLFFVSLLNYCWLWFGAMWRTLTIRYQRRYLPELVEYRKGLALLMIGWVAAFFVAVSIGLKDSYIISDDYARLANEENDGISEAFDRAIRLFFSNTFNSKIELSDEGDSSNSSTIDCVEITALQACVGHSTNSTSTLVLGRYNDPQVRGHAYCNTTMTWGIGLLIMMTPYMYWMYVSCGMQSYLRDVVLAIRRSLHSEQKYIEGCGCAVCKPEERSKLDDLPPLWRAYEWSMEISGVVGVIVYLLTNATFTLFSLGIGDFCTNGKDQKWILYFFGMGCACAGMCAPAWPRMLKDIYQAKATGKQTDCWASMMKFFLEMILPEQIREDTDGKHSITKSEINSVPWVFVSSPEHAPNDVKVMDHLQKLCRERPDLFYQGFDWASSGNSYPDDGPIWTKMSVLQTLWFTANTVVYYRRLDTRREMIDLLCKQDVHKRQDLQLKSYSELLRMCETEVSEKDTKIAAWWQISQPRDVSVAAVKTRCLIVPAEDLQRMLHEPWKKKIDEMSTFLELMEVDMSKVQQADSELTKQVAATWHELLRRETEPLVNLWHECLRKTKEEAELRKEVLRYRLAISLSKQTHFRHAWTRTYDTDETEPPREDPDRKSDLPLREAVSRIQRSYRQHLSSRPYKLMVKQMRGAVQAAAIDRMAPVLETTQWFKSYQGKVQGALQAACQTAPYRPACPQCGKKRLTGRCKAILVQGGPVSRCENKKMPEICTNVNIRGMDVRTKDVCIASYDTVEDMLAEAQKELKNL